MMHLLFLGMLLMEMVVSWVLRDFSVKIILIILVLFVISHSWVLLWIEWFIMAIILIIMAARIIHSMICYNHVSIITRVVLYSFYFIGYILFGIIWILSILHDRVDSFELHYLRSLIPIASSPSSQLTLILASTLQRVASPQLRLWLPIEGCLPLFVIFNLLLEYHMVPFMVIQSVMLLPLVVIVLLLRLDGGIVCGRALESWLIILECLLLMSLY